jgi:hypothetical protein
MAATNCKHNQDICNSVLATFNVGEWLGIEPAGHLYNDLTYLLREAQEWLVQIELDMQCSGYQVQVYTMDAAIGKARALFEFFTGKGANYCHAECLFDLSSQLSYPAYDTTGPRTARDPKRWANAMHVADLHLQDRGITTKLLALDGTDKDLNQMPADLARGVVALWKDFETKIPVSSDQALAKAARKQAENDAKAVIDGIPLRAEAYRKAVATHPVIPELIP